MPSETMGYKYSRRLRVRNCVLNMYISALFLITVCSTNCKIVNISAGD